MEDGTLVLCPRGMLDRARNRVDCREQDRNGDTASDYFGRCELVSRRRAQAAATQHTRAGAARRMLFLRGSSRLFGTAVRAAHAIGGAQRGKYSQDEGGDEPTHVHQYSARLTRPGTSSILLRC